MLGISQRVMMGSLIGGGGGGGFNPNAVTFDGTSDWLARGGGLTGAADAKQALLSFWFRLNGGDGVDHRFLDSVSSEIRFNRTTANKLSFGLRKNVGGTVWQGTSTNTFTVAGSEWVHWLFSIDSEINHKMFIDDVLETLTSETFAPSTIIDHTWTDWFVGSAAGGGAKVDADIAEFYYTNEFLDLTVEANRRKFIGADGKPVDLGADGSTPTGTAPLIYLSGDTVDWHTNKGSGGGFTENGALTDAPDGPGD